MTEGQHGTITHKTQGVSLTGQRTGSFPEDFTFLIDGSKRGNNFPYSDWTFTPDEPALPTEPGFYRPEKDLDWTGAYHLNRSGLWYYVNGLISETYQETPRTGRGRLIRLVPESTEAGS